MTIDELLSKAVEAEKEAVALRMMGDMAAAVALKHKAHSYLEEALEMEAKDAH